MIAHEPRINPAEIDVATQVDESDYFVMRGAVRYDLRNQADYDMLMLVMEVELAAMKHKWELVKAEADALLKSVEHGVF